MSVAGRLQKISIPRRQEYAKHILENDREGLGFRVPDCNSSTYFRGSGSKGDPKVPEHSTWGVRIVGLSEGRGLRIQDVCEVSCF